MCGPTATAIAARIGSRRSQGVALRAIAACRTALLGGRWETCAHGGATRLTFNSCRNRHCPTCPAQASARWIEARRADLLPIPYFHVGFTLPPTLNALAQGNPRVLYTLLFRAAADTLLTFGRDPRHLGGPIGVPRQEPAHRLVEVLQLAHGQPRERYTPLGGEFTGQGFNGDDEAWGKSGRDARPGSCSSRPGRRSSKKRLRHLLTI